MFCKSCGQQFNDNDKFCSKCGINKDLESSEKETAATRSDNTHQMSGLKQPVSLNTKRQLTIFGIIIAILMIVFFTICTFNDSAIFNEVKAKFTNGTGKQEIAVENLVLSKENYNLGLKQFNDKKYLEALDSLNKVIKEDKGSYNDAQDKINQCRKLYSDANFTSGAQLTTPSSSASTSSTPAEPSTTTATTETSPTPSPSAVNDYQNLKTRVDSLNQQVKINPNDIGLQQDLGNAYYDLASVAQQVALTEAKGYFNQAILHYQNVLKTKKDINVMTDLATAAFYAGQSDLADKTFKEALALQPDFEQALFNYGVFLSEVKKDYLAAISVWQKALDKNPKGPNADKILQLINQTKGMQDAK